MKGVEVLARKKYYFHSRLKNTFNLAILTFVCSSVAATLVEMQVMYSFQKRW